MCFFFCFFSLFSFFIHILFDLSIIVAPYLYHQYHLFILCQLSNWKQGTEHMDSITEAICFELIMSCDYVIFLYINVLVILFLMVLTKHASRTFFFPAITHVFAPLYLFLYSLINFSFALNWECCHPIFVYLHVYCSSDRACTPPDAFICSPAFFTWNSYFVSLKSKYILQKNLC